MKARRLRWVEHVARSNPSGSLYVTINSSIKEHVEDKKIGERALRGLERGTEKKRELSLCDRDPNYPLELILGRDAKLRHSRLFLRR
ncbi:unnamed protein product [Nezara viridula]|uniref:Uncharacterized protein n=1 Tax=Nezara viridula TaxID=85310 RepID=A0A9P0MX76_NEZVI|nr:unnamed protein product [Nezara viridula]